MSNRPIHEIKEGGIKLAVWANEKGESVTIDKRYKTPAGEWKSTNRFFESDISKLANVCKQYLDWKTTQAAGEEQAPPLSDNVQCFDDQDIPF